MKIGYIRISTEEQNTARQELLMQQLGVDDIFIDKLSGKNTERPELKRMMAYIRHGDTVVVCHNADFERSFLCAAYQKCGEEMLKNQFIDTIEMAKLIVPNAGSYKLSTLSEILGLPSAQQHRALPDCQMTLRLYTKLIEIFSENEKT